MALGMADLPDGRRVIGEAADQGEARRMIEREQGRESVSWDPRRQAWRWTLVQDDGKTHHGWAETAPEARLAIALAKHPDPVPHRMTGGRLPWHLPAEE
ncbi:hypothetical protein ACQPZA_20615 [Pseudonocardia xinjiangensis]|uniref:hypothetical protein n=1 Tax=Pseudonocardia xinjiangensis TaxID=75289 RepID=UPI003D8ADCD4